MFRGIQISGSFGPNAVVGTEDGKAINVAGGSISGDFFREAPSRQKKDYYADVRKLIEGMDSPLRDALLSALTLVETQTRTGTDNNVTSVDLVLTRIKSLAPDIFRLLIEAIIQHATSQSMRQMALDKVSEIAKEQRNRFEVSK